MAPTSLHDIKTLILSMQSLLVFETAEEERATDLLVAAARQLRMPVYEWSVVQGLVREGGMKLKDATRDPDEAFALIEKFTDETVVVFKDLGAHLGSARTARLLCEACQRMRSDRGTIALIGRTVELPSGLEHKAIRYELQLPVEAELHAAIKPLIESLGRTHKVRVNLEKSEYQELLSALRGLTLNQARQAVAHAVVEDGVLDLADIPRVLDRKAGLLRDGGLLEYFPAASNTFELGGFERLLQWLDRAAVGFSAEAKELGLRPPKGVVLVGVQGCGKSLAAKVAARRWRVPLLKLEAGSLYDKYIGETEKNFRRAIQVAEAMAPVVLWIDEIEKAFHPGGAGESDGGLTKRLLAAFLTWLQEGGQGVFVVATANDLSALPPELLRKGRFDEVFFVDLPLPPEREAIFRIQLQARKQDPAGVDLAELARATEGFSGAEIEQAVVSALYRCLHERCPLGTAEILREVAETVPLSVSRSEDIARLRSQAGRFVPVA